MTPPAVDVNDRDALLASLEAWRRRLPHDNHKLSFWRRTKARTKARIELRKKQLARLAAKSAGSQDARKRAKAVELALKDARAGVKEYPPGSNRGGRVDAMQRRFGIIAQPWCGAAVGTWLEEAGFDVPARVVYVPYVFADAIAQRNNWHEVSAREVKAGDAVCFDFQGDGVADHIALARGPVKNGMVPTVEGNTSYGTAGSQDNGGAVAIRERPVSQVQAFARFGRA